MTWAVFWWHHLPHPRRAHAQPEEHRPRHPAQHQLVVITGLSGSGKSSLAFDTLYAEGQRRYVESLSAYARQFLQLMDKPDVDVIEGLSPAISHRAEGHQPQPALHRGHGDRDPRLPAPAVCPRRHALLPGPRPAAAGADGEPDGRRRAGLPEDTRLMVLAPVARDRKGEFAELFAEMQAQGYVRFRVDGGIWRRRAAQAEEDREARHRRGGRPPQGARRHAAAPGRELRGRAAPGRRPRHRAGDGQRRANTLVQRQVRLPGVQLLAQPSWSRGCSPSTRPVGACPTCDGLGTGVLRPGAGGGLPHAEPGQRRGQGLGPAQRLLLRAAGEPGQTLQASTSRRRSSRCPRRCSTCCCTARATRRSSSATPMESGQAQARSSTRKHPFEGIIPNMERRYRETDSVAVREELARYRSLQPCPDCAGTRLRARRAT
jgi:excinuclease ABC subunit A